MCNAAFQCLLTTGYRILWIYSHLQYTCIVNMYPALPWSIGGSYKNVDDCPISKMKEKLQIPTTIYKKYYDSKYIYRVSACRATTSNTRIWSESIMLRASSLHLTYRHNMLITSDNINKIKCRGLTTMLISQSNEIRHICSISADTITHFLCGPLMIW